jgi:hypothetical protein
LFDGSEQPKPSINQAQSAKNEPKIIVDIQYHIHFEVLGAKQEATNTKNQCRHGEVINTSKKTKRPFRFFSFFHIGQF